MLTSRIPPRDIFKAAALLLIILLIFSHHSGLSTVRSRIVDGIAAPLKVFLDTRTFLKKFIPFASYRDQIQQFKTQTASLESEVTRLREFYKENQRLKKLLDFKQNISFSVIAGQVIARDPSNWSNAVIIDKGLNQGIRLNAAALTAEGLVGRVVETGRISSKVLLITDPNFKVGVILEKAREGGLLVGWTEGKCKVIYLSLDEPVTIGDTVVTAGYGADFPKGLTVGTVIGVEKEPGRLYKYAIVRPAQNLSKLEEIVCVK